MNLRSTSKTEKSQFAVGSRTAGLSVSMPPLPRLRSRMLRQAATGAYTYGAGRIWALVLLKNEPRIAKALALRFPHILVDEAQDIGPFEGALLDGLSAAGNTISLVGDFHQSIYSFNFATGEYLRNFTSRADVLKLPLTQNRRSVESIVKAANLLAGTDSTHFRTLPARLTGTYFWRYDLKGSPRVHVILGVCTGCCWIRNRRGRRPLSR